MNFLGTHDTERIINILGSEQKVCLAYALLAFLPGLPTIYYGDEVGLTGGGDPDCRRGMLWDENRQDLDMLAYYKRLIAVRKNNSCLTMGDPDEVSASDETGLVTIRRGNLVILFHGKEGTISLPEYAGKLELISGQRFDGRLDAYQAAVIEL